MLKVKFYIRYVDDFVILSRDREELSEWKEKIRDFLKFELNLKLHPKRMRLQPISNGIDFLGYITRRNYILVRRRVINNMKMKLKCFGEPKYKTWKALRDSIQSYLGHFKWANSYSLVKRLGISNY
ncbi:hypothetical protein KA005_50735 [bacterium]|nr:hypothetical protein [bacterium]